MIVKSLLWFLVVIYSICGTDEATSFARARTAESRKRLLRELAISVFLLCWTVAALMSLPE
jgi:hypothetical protein